MLTENTLILTLITVQVVLCATSNEGLTLPNACESMTDICVRKMEIVQAVFTKGDFSSLIGDDTLTLNCSDIYLDNVSDCMAGLNSTCGGFIPEHPKLFYSAYNFICKRQEDFLEAEYCLKGNKFASTLIACSQKIGTKDKNQICQKYPLCVQRKIAQDWDCSSRDSITLSAFFREALKMKYSQC